jgi:hypothetical protein
MTFLQKATPSSGFKDADEGSKDAEAASASFEPSSASLNPLEGDAFCRKVISARLSQYCLRGLCGNFGPQKRFRNG